MTDFSKEIQDFQKTGVYVYKFDTGGNLIFNQSSSEFNQNYLSIPLLTFKYDNTKINSFYDIAFKEFIPTVSVQPVPILSSIDINKLEQDNQDLTAKLNTLLEESKSSVTDSERLAVKQIIIDLRIKLKEGVAERDFSTVFPYLPLLKDKKQ